ncbi:hypothetical protein JW964_19350 [candidate division KSB1 bacterium]|nr:hypothetical protein [candidate division KSB1 bacterium]
MRVHRYLVGSMLIFLSIIFVGCYTMLNHPSVMEDQSIEQATAIEGESLEAIETPISEVNHGENCIDCHTQRNIPLQTGYMGSDITIYEENHGDISEYYWQITPSANYYYSKPWWANEFYYTPVPSQQLGSENALPTPNDFSRRRPSSNANSGATSSSIGGGSAASALSKQLSDDNENSTRSTSKRASTDNRQNAAERGKKSSESGNSTTKKTSSKTTEAK